MTATRTFVSTYTVVLASIASAIVLTACGPEDGSKVAAVPATQPVTAPAQVAVNTPPAAPRVRHVAEPERAPVRRNVGEVSHIEPITETAKPSGAGAVIGGVAGGLLGNQVGGGNGKKAATVLGVVGGAYAGNQVEKHRNEKVVGYRVSVHLDQGGSRTVRLASLNGLEVGERVRVDGDNLHRI